MEGSISVAGRGILLVAAHPKEVAAVVRGLGGEPADLAPGPAAWALCCARAGFDVVRSGVGKANAAGCLARTLDPARHHLVLNVGVAGVLPGVHGVGVGGVVLGSESVFADEGLARENGFEDLAAMGLGEPALAGAGVRFPAEPCTLDRLRPLAHVVAPIACVSTCSGTDALAGEVAQRTGAIAEAMEGAACALVAARLGVPFAELRVISNTTGDRARQAWDLAGALRVLEGVIGRLAALTG